MKLEEGDDATRPAPLTVVIATAGRQELLARTLSFLAASALPDNLSRVVVAENGVKGGAEATTRSFAGRLPMQYEYTAEPNKSHAMNAVLKKTGDDFVIFFDDDIRVGEGTLSAYRTAVGRAHSGLVLGGPVDVDYEQVPPPWLVPYLPITARGWSKPSGELEESEAFLGANWGAFAADLRRIGGFNQQLGPGLRAGGEETEIQHRLLAAGVRRRYLADAVIWHFVPQQRCTIAWTLERAGHMSPYEGSRIARGPRGPRWRHAAYCLLKVVVGRMCLATIAWALSERRRFYFQYLQAWNSGLLRGMGGRLS